MNGVCLGNLSACHFGHACHRFVIPVLVSFSKICCYTLLTLFLVLIVSVVVERQLQGINFACEALTDLTSRVLQFRIIDG